MSVQITPLYNLNHNWDCYSVLFVENASDGRGNTRRGPKGHLRDRHGQEKATNFKQRNHSELLKYGYASDTTMEFAENAFVSPVLGTSIWEGDFRGYCTRPVQQQHSLAP